jgi:hypothetical protein
LRQGLVHGVRRIQPVAVSEGRRAGAG